MVALRKDVKVGLTIGAIVVAVVGVYAGLSAVAGDETAGSDQIASLRTTPQTPVSDDTQTSIASRTTGGTPTRSETATRLPTAPSQDPPAVANPPIPVASGNPVTTDDPWASAFSSGRIEPAVTVTPDPSGRANTIDRADVLKSLAGTETPVEPIAETPAVPSNATASANDGSGALKADTTPPTLTRANDKTHTIEAGETFSSISVLHYGESRYYQDIINANPDVNPNRLKPGTKIRIPELTKRQPASDTVDLPAISTATIDPAKQYVVKTGDSLHKIASKLYGDIAYAEKLYELNRSAIGADPAKLKLNMVLVLPEPPTKKQ